MYYFEFVHFNNFKAILLFPFLKFRKSSSTALCVCMEGDTSEWFIVIKWLLSLFVNLIVSRQNQNWNSDLMSPKILILPLYSYAIHIINIINWWSLKIK